MRKRGKKSLIISKSILPKMPLFFFKKHTQPKRMGCYGSFSGMEISSLVMALPKSWLFQQKGVIIAFRYGSEYKLLSPEIVHVDDDGRYINVHIEIQESPYILLNYYDPNNESYQVKLLRQISSKLQSISFDDNVQFISAGDWNMIFDKV